MPDPCLHFNFKGHELHDNGCVGPQEAEEKRKNVLEGDIYSNPPPITQTVLGGSRSSSEAEYDTGKFGPGQ
eukprot:scaffold421208_cov48-Prasinocladus_malaysianus.AAC.1